VGGRFDKAALIRLQGAVEQSYRDLEVHRRHRVERVKAFAGPDYGDNGYSHSEPINLLQMASLIYKRKLAAKAPKAMVDTKYAEMKPAAASFGGALNQKIEDMRLELVIQDATMEALLGYGIVKIGLEQDGVIEIDGETFERGSLFVAPVSLDDWVQDMRAKRWEDIGFCGERHPVPLDIIREAYGDDVVDKVGQGETKPVGGEERASDMSQENTISDPFIPVAWLWDIWIPSLNLIVTYADDHREEALEVREWTGPKGGPYETIRFIGVPDNAIPLPPAAAQMDLNDIVNNTFRKLQKQAERQKQVGLVRTGNEEDGKRIIDAIDGEVIRSDDPQSYTQASFGGPSQENVGWMMLGKDLFSWISGNLDALGGLSPVSDTVGQEQLITEAVSEIVGNMQDEIRGFVQRIIHQIAFYVWNDPFMEIPYVKTVPGVPGLQIPGVFTWQDRQGSLMDYAITIVPYSMEASSPAKVLQTIGKFMAEFYGPLMPVFQQQNYTLNIGGLVDLYAEHTNTPSLRDLFVVAGQDRSDAGALEEMMKQPTQTTRRYERVNRPGATQQGKDQALIRQMFGETLQPAESAQIGRASS